MKTLIQFINEGSLEFPMKGVLKKGDEVTILWLDTWPWDDNKTPKIVDVENGKVEKVVSKDVGRYSGDQHTWAYVNGIRYELRAEKKDIYLGIFDRSYSKNPHNKFAIISTPEQADKLKGKNNKLNL